MFLSKRERPTGGKKWTWTRPLLKANNKSNGATIEASSRQQQAGLGARRRGYNCVGLQPTKRKMFVVLTKLFMGGAADFARSR